MTSAILLVRHSVFGLAMHAAFIWFYESFSACYLR
jgi:hypothetical protein